MQEIQDSVKEIQFQIDKVAQSINTMYPVWALAERKMIELKLRLKELEIKKSEIVDGQLAFLDIENF